MSSLTRRLEIRGMKACGFARTHYKLLRDVTGTERPVHVSRGGLILNSDDEPVGYHWPRAANLRTASA